MALFTAALLGAIAWTLACVRGLWLDLPTDHFFAYSGIVCVAFSYIGFCAGLLAQKLLREHKKTIASKANSE